MKKLLALGLLLLFCTGCAQPVEEPAPAPEPVPQVEPAEPAPAPQPEPEPEPVYDPAEPVIVDGVTLESLRIHGTPYVALEDLAGALDAAWTGEDGGSLTWRHRIYPLGGFAPEPVTHGGRLWVPAEALCTGIGLASLRDEERQQIFFGSAAGQMAEIPAGIQVPVLMYHGVGDEMWGSTDLFVRPEVLEACLQYLTENGFTPIFFEELPRADQIEKPVLLTFDDGYRNNYENLFPLLQKYQVKATIFVVTGTVDFNPNVLTTDQIREMSDSGLVSIQSHTVTHPYLAYETEEEQRRELEDSRLHITRATGKIPYALCYPSGSASTLTRDLAKNWYHFGINMDGGLYETGMDPYGIPRRFVSRRHSLQAFQQLVNVWE